MKLIILLISLWSLVFIITFKVNPKIAIHSGDVLSGYSVVVK